MSVKHLVLGVTGASGIVYAQRFLEVCRQLPDIKTHLIISPAAELTLKQEADISLAAFKQLADFVHGYDDIGDSLASGSFRTDAMVILPCSVKTLSSVANCYDADLITRTADVHLKERRGLILCLRESPLHLGHLRLLTQVAEYGAQVMPLVTAFYHRPKTIDDLVNQFVARIFDQLRIDYPADLFSPWTGISNALKEKVQEKRLEREQAKAQDQALANAVHSQSQQVQSGQTNTRTTAGAASSTQPKVLGLGAKVNPPPFVQPVKSSSSVTTSQAATTSTTYMCTEDLLKPTSTKSVTTPIATTTSTPVATTGSVVPVASATATPAMPAAPTPISGEKSETAVKAAAPAITSAVPTSQATAPVAKPTAAPATSPTAVPAASTKPVASAVSIATAIATTPVEPTLHQAVAPTTTAQPASQPASQPSGWLHTRPPTKSSGRTAKQVAQQQAHEQLFGFGHHEEKKEPDYQDLFELGLSATNPNLEQLSSEHETSSQRWQGMLANIAAHDAEIYPPTASTEDLLDEIRPTLDDYVVVDDDDIEELRFRTKAHS